MDPLTLAGTFATIVGLLSNFKAERSGAQLGDFILWLREQHQDGVAQSISQNEQLKQTLSRLLATNQDDLVARLKEITDQLREIAAHVEGFNQLSLLFTTVPPLSTQGKSILSQMSASTAKFFMEHPSLAGTQYLLLDGDTGQMEGSEPSFLKEDFEMLANAGYLRVEFTSKGNPRYYITRKGKHAAGNA